jgi:hypothetical protein
MDLSELSKNPDQLKQLISLLQNMLPSDDTDESSEEPSPIKTKSSRKPKGQTQSSNKFLNMPEMNMHKEDSEIDKRLSKHPPVARSREFEPVTVKCRVCGKEETLNPSLVESVSRYKCNKCSSSAG